MIESISLSNIATYRADKSEVINLKKINFIYGANGAGKTTISRLIDKPSLSIDSSITWLRNMPMPAMIYNNDFITANFSESKEFQGVFTLGKAEKVQLDRLKALKDEKKRYEQLRAKLITTLDGEDGKPGKNAELNSLETKLVSRCWEQKVKHDEYFKGAFTGLRNNKEAFKARVLQELDNNESPLVDLFDLKARAEILYGEQPSKIDLVSPLDLSRLIAFEKSPVLVKKVVGKNDVSISAIIQRLGNSDWVRHGMRFLEHTDEQCPFCQQNLPHDFEKELTDYFDETFEADSKAVFTLRNNYFQISGDILEQAHALLELNCIELDKEKLNSKISALDAIVLVNKGRMENKITTPSVEVSLEGLEDIQADISSIIKLANAKISEKNRLVSSFTAEQRKLTAEVWKYIIDAELKNTLTDYTTDKSKLQKSISGITLSRDKATEDINAADVEINKIEAELTSVKPTVIAINKILKNFGFLSFSLDPACADNSYRIIRADGRNAKQTLSEGEKTFVTFLYFYHLLRGSITTSGITADRIVVIDDPVSSLDSDVLFIVSSLIKELFTEVRKHGSHLKQVVVLTHNVHFHKEVAYDQRRNANTSLADETFWIVRKPNEHSVIEFHPSNPIKNSYQLLWAELNKTPMPVLTLQNTMRRILENYFKILGGVDTYHLVDKFEGIEKTQCQSLMSWVNDGSHYAPDELYVAISDNMAASYLKIFFKIFKAAKHDAHYRMMMGDSFVDLDPEEISEQQDMDGINEDSKVLIDDVNVIEKSALVQTAFKSDIEQPRFDQDMPF
ncbi:MULTISPECIES: AAA family ATPase [unclassified Pantoea]|uniref:AAA family ATPase n=1 Tax=unclassified Pantoea TaxID=2630326 RepID=UPI0023DA6F57|nr:MULTISPECIES: AAA family ATPase [unclassified Pantoea]MDF2043726.1 AAA family ATPase [Pantoea sp. Cr_R14]MDF2071993.1 AAA family ATPase [Pantoea sp. Cr_R13]MDF2080901.1 AAA family ATPase [Pantoea sp. Cr_R21]